MPACSVVVVLIAAVCCRGRAADATASSASTISLNVYEQSTELALVSIGQTLAILTGGIDLSVGSLISLSACLTSGLINGDPDRIVPVVAAVLALGTLVGVLNASLSSACACIR